MANMQYNDYTNPGNLLDTDIWAFSRAPHTGGGTFFKTTPLDLVSYLQSKNFVTGVKSSSNTPSTIVERDASGNFSAGTITANLTGNASNFTGALVGDVTGTQGATVVSLVGGSTATLVHSAELLANGATSVNTANAIVKRDASGNFSMGTLTASGFSVSAGPSGANITGANPALNVGPTGNIDFNFGRATTGGAFFGDAASGDGCIRVAAAATLRLGCGSVNSSLIMTSSLVSSRVNLSLVGATNPTITVGTNANLARSTAAAAFFSNDVSGDVILRQTDTTKTIRIGSGTGAQTSGLDISLTQVSVNLATLACAGSLNVAVNGNFTGTLASSSITTGAVILPTTGGTPGNLNYYEESTAFNVSMSTPDGTNHNLPVTATRIGKMVTLISNGLSVTSNSSAQFVAAAGQVPARFRPSSSVAFLDNVEDNTIPVIGIIGVLADGGVRVAVGVTAQNFQSTGQASILSFSVSYLTA